MRVTLVLSFLITGGLIHKHCEERESGVRLHVEPHKLGNNDEIHETDVLFCTHWSTADIALKFKKQAKQIMYFVQDFEPFFYQMGPEYIMAEKSYQLGLYHITSFPWLPHLIKKRYGGKADYYLPPIDCTIYKKNSRLNNSH